MIALCCPHCASRFRASPTPGQGTTFLKCTSCGFVFLVKSGESTRLSPLDDDQAESLPQLTAIEGLAGELPEEGEFTAMGTALDALVPRHDRPNSGEGSLIVGDGGVVVPLQKFKTTIGRRNADILVDDVDVSRQHAVIEKYDDKYLLKDLESTNGTFLNGQQVAIEFLKDGDTIRLGRTLIRFHQSPAALGTSP